MVVGADSAKLGDTYIAKSDCSTSNDGIIYSMADTHNNKPKNLYTVDISKSAPTADYNALLDSLKIVVL